MKTKPKTISLDELTDKYIGKRGTKQREAFEMKVRKATLSSEITEIIAGE